MKAAATKLAFDNGGAFIQDTRREVEQYLSRGSTRIKGAVLLYAKAPIALALTAVSWSVLIFVQPGLVRRDAVPPRARRRGDADRLLRPARREPRRLLQAAPLEPPRRLVDRLAARLLELRLAREAQRRPPHLHERRRVRRRRHPGPARPLHPVPARPALVPLPAVLHLADVHADGPALADGRRPRRVPAWQRRRERPAGAARLEPRRRVRRQGVLHHLGDRDPAARLPVVGRPRCLRRVHHDHEPDHGDDVPARPLRRGGIVRLGGRAPRASAGSGPCTRSRRPSTSARATRC